MSNSQARESSSVFSAPILQAQGLSKHVDSGERLDHLPKQLSGGEQQRVAVARAFVTRPELVFADEPTGNLDTERSIEIMELLTRLNHEGITILMVTHEKEMAAFANTIVHFRDGLVESVERGNLAKAEAAR